MIRFPKPLNWFQKKFWRIKWLEWNVILLIIFLPKSLNESVAIWNSLLFEYISFLVMIPIMALISPFIFGLMFNLTCIWPLRLMDSIGGVHIFGSFADLFDKLRDIVSSINNGILSIFCEENV